MFCKSSSKIGCDVLLEVDLVNDINRYLQHKGILYSNELRMGIGIPDITVNLGANRRMKPLDDYFLVSILEYINEMKKVTICQIQETFTLGIEKVKQCVSTLANLCLVEIKKNIVKILRNIFSVNLGTTISIEAKLKDWKGACLQAQRYLCFSDYSYVALPIETIRNVDFSLFHATGIGLLSVDGAKVCEVIPATKSLSCDFILKYIGTSKVIEKNTATVKRHLRPNIFSAYI
jgi:hypothetical protein